MIKEDRPAYKKLLKTITKGKDSELSYLLQDFNDVQRICRCLSAIIRQDGFEELCIKKNKEQSEKLCNLVRRHKQLVKKLTHHSNNKNIIKKKQKILTGGFFPLIPILTAALPALISIISRNV